MEGMCPWIDPDDKTRVAQITKIIKTCWMDPDAYTDAADTVPAIEGILILVLYNVECSRCDLYL